jgi:hypothetical protein
MMALERQMRVAMREMLRDALEGLQMQVCICVRTVCEQCVDSVCMCVCV